MEEKGAVMLSTFLHIGAKWKGIHRNQDEKKREPLNKNNLVIQLCQVPSIFAHLEKK